MKVFRIPQIAGLSVLFACLACAGDAAAGTERAAGRPNILFLISDDQRPDTIAALGNPIIQTPHLDSLVRQGTTFTRAICANPICTPSRAEILSGCDSFRNGVLDFGRKIDPELTTWAQALQSAGYRTWYTGKWHNDGLPTERGYVETDGLYRGGGGQWWKDTKDWQGRPITGYRGWVFQTDDGRNFPQMGVGLTADISSHFADAAIRFIQRKSTEPFFLHVNFTAPHDPLIMPPGYDQMYPPQGMPLPKNFEPRHPFDHGNFEGRDEKLLAWPRTEQAVREELAMYYRVITHMDAQIGRILEALEETGQAENTIVVFASDHGLAVGSHGLRGKQNMYEHTIGVPLIFRGPGIPRGERRRAQVYLRDIYPTTCDLAGAAIPDTVQGRSLKGVLSGREEEVHDAVFGYFRNFQRMIRTKNWKLIYYPHLDRYQLFDLKNDPAELKDLVDDQQHAETLAQLKTRLHAWQKQVEDPALEAANTANSSGG